MRCYSYRYSYRSALLTLMLSALCIESQATTHSLGIQRKLYGESIAYDMNASGQVAAVIKEKNGISHAVVLDKGKLTRLEGDGESESEAKRINEKGEIIGSAKRDGIWRAFIYSNANGRREIASLGGRHSYGAALNNSGTAVGFSDTPDGDWHAFIQKDGKAVQDLGTLGGKVSYASSINARDQVVGTAMDSEGYRHAFLYDEATGMRDLGTLGGKLSTATALNDHGVVVGSSETKDRRWHAFIHDGTRMVDLGAKIGFGDSFATGINNQGHVVGIVDVPDMRLAFVWRDNKMILHPSGKSLYLTNAINNQGHVIGASYDRGLNAATMPSNSVPFVDYGGSKILGFNMVFFGLALLMAIFRKRLKGIFYSDRLPG
ncbi:HAF repeat-containing protein [Undibacterium crateris]|uniref:HAF repeat-containing protein n=1 Tax=Undibacterium crateris TaxID=2528175 RepID=UPI001389CB66|nr:HAF repeat-containing protein [Undibacterium crateris]NDI84343.1 HAF repeat-containing protein [Undibacterium crateris]